jgi:hypothetical protein
MAKKNAKSETAAAVVSVEPVTEVVGTGTVVSDEKVAAVLAKKERRESKSQAEVIAAIVVGSKSTPKLTSQQVADKLGMEKSSFDQRLNSIRTLWLDYGFTINVKAGKTAKDLGLTQESFDRKLARVKAYGDNPDSPKSIYATMEETDPTPYLTFPYTLADGREAGGNSGGGVMSVRNAIMAAMLAVPTPTEPAEKSAE